MAMRRKRMTTMTTGGKSTQTTARYWAAMLPTKTRCAARVARRQQQRLWLHLRGCGPGRVRVRMCICLYVHMCMNIFTCVHTHVHMCIVKAQGGIVPGGGGKLCIA